MNEFACKIGIFKIYMPFDLILFWKDISGMSFRKNISSRNKISLRMRLDKTF